MKVILKDGKEIKIKRLDCNLVTKDHRNGCDTFLVDESEIENKTVEEITNLLLDNISDVTYEREDGKKITRHYSQLYSALYVFSDDSEFLSVSLKVSGVEENVEVYLHEDF